jgi:hypothetical protein
MHVLIVAAVRTPRSPDTCSVCVGRVLALAAPVAFCRFDELFPVVRRLLGVTQTRRQGPAGHRMTCASRAAVRTSVSASTQKVF